MAIIETAAKLLRNDIKDLTANKIKYPSPAMLESTESNVEFLPETLKVFLETLFQAKKSEIKIASIGQAMTQAVRPRVLLAPLQIELGVQLHHHFASKFLMHLLFNLGFCSSYSEVSRFESSAVVARGEYLPVIGPENIVQFSADNVDHNLNTLDGHDSFIGNGHHCMLLQLHL